jgi:hypothetical protein
VSYSVSKAVQRMRQKQRKTERDCGAMTEEEGRAQLTAWAVAVAPPEFRDRALEWTTAYHESGHAVTSELWDFPVELVSIVPETDEHGATTLGVCQHVVNEENDGVNLFGPARIRFWMAKLLAGSAAEHKLGSSPKGVVSTTDIRELKPMLVELHPNKRRTVFDDVTELANKTINRPDVWKAIETLALRLLANPSTPIMGADVRAIVRKEVADEEFMSEAQQILIVLKLMAQGPEPNTDQLAVFKKMKSRLVEIMKIEQANAA